jgi:diphthine-ammonia ligase
MEVLAGVSWSGGKDSCYAIMQAVQNGVQLKVLINMMNENGMISRSHGLPFFVLQMQSEAMGIPLIGIPSSWNEYEKKFVEALQLVKTKYGVNTMVFGDIDLQEHRDWEEMVCRKAGLDALLPIWKKDRKQLVLDMISSGIESIIVSCNTLLGEEFLGKTINENLVHVLEDKGVDVCGENGEFHTVVTNCPLFKNKIVLPSFTKIKHEEFWFLQFREEVEK